MALVSLVPQAQRGKVLTDTNCNTAIALDQLHFGLTFGGPPAIVALAFCVRNWLFPNLANDALPVAAGLIISGALSMYLYLQPPLSAQFMLAKAMSEFRRRDDLLVEPDHSDSILIQVIPRCNWGNWSLWTSTEDIAFMLLDHEQRQLLIEGDKKRYRLPMQALTSFQTEAMYPETPGGLGWTGVVTIHYEDPESFGEQEICFQPMPRSPDWLLWKGSLERSNEVLRRIEDWSLLGLADK